MSATINELRRNNTSGVPGMRLNVRRGYLVIDVAWYTYKRCSTSYLVGRRPLLAVAAAMAKRATVGASYDMTLRQAWERLKRSRRGS